MAKINTKASSTRRDPSRMPDRKDRDLARYEQRMAKQTLQGKRGGW
jgi:hypothetical protein